MLKILVVDDDDEALELEATLLESAGHKVLRSHTGSEALTIAKQDAPDVVVADMMMPEMDGLELCRLLREVDELSDTKIIFVTAKAYEFDRVRAFSFGADGFITKPINIESFVREIDKIVNDQFEIVFWGVRGTLPVPGKHSLRYDGNTSCVTLEFGRDQFFIFDAGTGIKSLSDHLLDVGRTRLNAKIFISHPHWDHINALPYFAPLYIQGNEFEILGAKHGDVSMRELISSQMDDVYFPVTIREFGSRVYFRDLREEEFEVDHIKIRTMLLSHPGYCLGYRVEYNGRSVCYITDNELYLDSNPHHNPHYEHKLVEFVKHADVLITDTTYTDEEYRDKVGWGHSCISKVTELAHRAAVKSLYLFHHDPDQSDDDIDSKLEAARAALKSLGSSVECHAPSEREMINL